MVLVLSAQPVFVMPALLMNEGDPASRKDGGSNHHHDSCNIMAVFTIFTMSLGVNSIKAEKKSENADHFSL